MKKKTVLFILTVVMAGVLAACGPKVELLEEPVIDYGETDKFSQEDMDAGIEIIKQTMDTWGIEYNLQKISYGGDDLSDLGLLYVDFLTETDKPERCMVLLADYVCLSSKSSAYKKNELYENHEWYLVPDENGGWMMFTNGKISEYIKLDDLTS